MNKENVLKIIAIIGNIGMLIGCIFLILNLTLDRLIFPPYVTIPLMIMGIVGSITGIFSSRWR